MRVVHVCLKLAENLRLVKESASRRDSLRHARVQTFAAPRCRAAEVKPKTKESQHPMVSDIEQPIDMHTLIITNGNKLIEFFPDGEEVLGGRCTVRSEYNRCDLREMLVLQKEKRK
jgi:hypothetical protein